MKTILITIIVLAVGFLIGIKVAGAITIEKKELTLTQYSLLKTALIMKYQTQGYFTVNEWQTYAAVLNWEAKAGKLKLQNITKQNLISKINELIK